MNGKRRLIIAHDSWFALHSTDKFNIKKVMKEVEEHKYNEPGNHDAIVCAEFWRGTNEGAVVLRTHPFQATP